MNHQVPQTEGTPLKERADFIAGYDAGMVDAKRMWEMKERDYKDELRKEYRPARLRGNKLKFNVEFARRSPLIALGFITPLEFVIVIWPVSFRIAWGF